MGRKLLKVAYRINGCVDNHEFTAESVSVTLRGRGRGVIHFTKGEYTDKGVNRVVNRALYGQIESVLIFEDEKRKKK